MVKSGTCGRVKRKETFSLVFVGFLVGFKWILVENETQTKERYSRIEILILNAEIESWN